MSAENIERVGIIGGGTMGSGIAEIVARHGLDVVIVEVDQQGADKALDRIQRWLDGRVAKGRMDQTEADAIRDRIRAVTDMSALADRELIVEAVPEILALKQEAFRQIDTHAADDAIIATNTSSLPVMDMAVCTTRPNRVLGFHFFNPAPVMKLIELVRTVVTDESVVDRARTFAEQIGKVPVVVGDRRGFIANQLLFPYLNQAVGMVEAGYASAEDVDAAMRLGAGLPMGPIALVDLVGIDTMVGIMDAIHSQFTDTRFAPRPMLRQLAAAGYTGRKSGQGFFAYDRPDGRPVKTDATDGDKPANPWKRVGVVGTGTMAAGIAQVCAQAGCDVVLHGRSRQKADTAEAGISQGMQRDVDRERLDHDDMVAALQRITTTDKIDDLKDCDVVIEAVVEDLDVKTELLATLDSVCKPDTVLATSTSSLPVVECAAVTERPERVIGLHFFNPAPRMQLVEVVSTIRTSPDLLETATDFVKALGKHPVHCADRSGFIVNALLFPYLNDAVRMLDSHYATSEDIDRAMKLGCGYPLGPFELMDIIGLDVTLAIMEALHAEFREPSYEPVPLLRHMVDAEFLGKKVGRGWYVHG